MDILNDILPASADRYRQHTFGHIDWTDHAQFTIDGNRFTFDRAPWLRPIMEDDAREKVFRKGSQVMISSYGLTRVLWGADQHGERWIYFLPTDDETDDFVADRVEKTIRDSDYLRGRVGHTDNRGLKHIGPGTVYFRGLWTKRRAKSVPADGLLFDEVDEHKPQNLVLSRDRILASEKQILIYLSVPSFTNYGIDQMFQDADQRFWVHRCPACGKLNSVDNDWPHNFIPIARNRKKSFPDGATHYRGCRFCDAPLDMRQGEWLPKHPSRRVHGYHLSRLFTLQYPPDFPNAATYLWHEYEESKGSQEKTARWNIAFKASPYDGEGARVNDDLLKGLETDHGFFYEGHGCLMGVDQGDNLHVSIYLRVPGRRLRLVYCEVTQQWDRLDALFDRFGCYAAGIDGRPNRNDAKKFAANHPGRVFVHDLGDKDIYEDDGSARKRKRYDEPAPRRRKISKLPYHGKNGIVQVPWFVSSRTETLDATVDFVESGRVLLPSRRRLTGEDRRRYDEWRKNVINLKWKMEETPSGPKRVYLRSDNHHGMGLNTTRLVAYELNIRPPSPGTLPVFKSTRMGNA